MKTTISLFWQDLCAPSVDSVAWALETVFPVCVVLESARQPSRQAFDTACGRYDALYLLNELPEQLSLWLVAEDISYPGYGCLFGAALRNSTVVSSARIGFGKNLQKEACHELGHLLGLGHCPNPCIMNKSRNPQKLSSKPMALCPECAAQTSNNENSNPQNVVRALNVLVRHEGLEPPTDRFEVCDSIH